MTFAVLGWPADGPTLSLDHERFSYAGKFVMSSTGKAVLRSDADAAITDDKRNDDSEAVLAAVAFNEDRTDPETLWIRYVTVRADRRGEGLGPRLLRRTVDRATDRGYERVRIAVNNPFAYEAAWKSGFGYTGEQTGIAELVMEHPSTSALARHDADARVDQSDDRGDQSDALVDRYHEGLREYRERDVLSDPEREFVAARLDAAPPAPIELHDP